MTVSISQAALLPAEEEKDSWRVFYTNQDHTLTPLHIRIIQQKGLQHACLHSAQLREQ